MSVLLRVAYDGTDFHGFARQEPNRGRGETEAVRTVQATLDDALSRLYKSPTRTRGASRTDAGVHARGQLVAFDPPFEIPLLGLQKGLSACLPGDLSVTAAWHEDGVVEPRVENGGKRYVYRVRCARSRDPLMRRFEWHLARALSWEAMLHASTVLLGEHDFAAFRANDCQAKSTIRTLRALAIAPEDARVGPITDPGRLDRGDVCNDPAGTVHGPVTPRADAARERDLHEIVTVTVEGTAFLKNMVRIVVGSLVLIGLGQRDERWLREVLESRERRRAGPTAPPHGLSLDEVIWIPRESHG